jgi:hypothetical protein
LKSQAIELTGDNMAYKIDPITGQIIKQKTDEAIPTNKPFNSREYVGYSKDFNRPNSIVDSIVPIENRQIEPEVGGYANLASLLKGIPSSMPAVEKEKTLIEPQLMGRYKQGTPEYSKNVLAEGLEFDDDQDSQLQKIQEQATSASVNDNEASALDDKYDQLYNSFRQANKLKYRGGN